MALEKAAARIVELVPTTMASRIICSDCKRWFTRAVAPFARSAVPWRCPDCSEAGQRCRRSARFR